MSRRVEVAFDTAGGRSSGIGHVVRSVALAAQVGGLGPRVTFIEPLPPIAGAGPIRLTRGRPDVVVVDRPDTSKPLLCAHHRRWPAARLIALDYYDDAVDGLVAVINLNAARERTGVKRPREYRQGLQYATLRPTFEARRRRRRAVPAAVRRVLLGFGGTDAAGWIRTAVDVLASTLPAGVVVDVLAGSEATAPFRFGHPVSRVRMHTALADPSALLACSDLAVIGGGTTMLEAACLGLPAVVVPRTKEERVFARQFARAGAVRIVRVGDRFPGAAVRREVTALLADSTARAGMRQAGRRLVDGRGADRVARLIVAAGEITR